MAASQKYLSAGAFLGMLAVFLFVLHGGKTEAAGSSPITGYVWSDTIGWIDLNCSNSNVCGTNNFGFSVGSDGTISGYAWSDNIGWVSANAGDVAGCPSGTCTPRISSGAMTGWLKALAADGNGWDGWISLAGSGYGPIVSNGAFSGYSWGSDVIGWVDWSLAYTTYTPCTAHYYCSGNNQRHQDVSCNDTFVQTCPYQCGGGACLTPPTPPTTVSSSGYNGFLQALPSLVRSGTAANLHWNITYVSNCTITGPGISWTGTTAGCANNTCTSGSIGKPTNAITQQSTFTMQCTALSDGSATTSSATVNILPVFQEI